MPKLCTLPATWGYKPDLCDLLTFCEDTGMDLEDAEELLAASRAADWTEGE